MQGPRGRESCVPVPPRMPRSEHSTSPATHRRRQRSAPAAANHFRRWRRPRWQSRTDHLPDSRTAATRGDRQTLPLTVCLLRTQPDRTPPARGVMLNRLADYDRNHPVGPRLVSPHRGLCAMSRGQNCARSASSATWARIVCVCARICTRTSGFARRLRNHIGCVGRPPCDATRTTRAPSATNISGVVRDNPLLRPVVVNRHRGSPNFVAADAPVGGAIDCHVRLGHPFQETGSQTEIRTGGLLGAILRV